MKWDVAACWACGKRFRRPASLSREFLWDMECPGCGHRLMAEGEWENGDMEVDAGRVEGRPTSATPAG